MIKKRQVVVTQTLYTHKLCAMTKSMAQCLYLERYKDKKPAKIQNIYPKNSTYRKNRHKLKMFGLAEKQDDGRVPTDKCISWIFGKPIPSEVHIRCTDSIPSEIESYGGDEITIDQVKENKRHDQYVQDFKRQKKNAF